MSRKITEDTERKAFQDSFLEGNESIEAAIDKFYSDRNKDNLEAVLEAIRQRMHADGHFIFPVLVDENDESRFAFRSVSSKDGKHWNVAFTSQAEYEKGEPSRVLSYFIDGMLKSCLDSETDGLIINPWGQSFVLRKEDIDRIFRADGDVEYTVPGDPITTELLEGGTFLKRAISICNRNRTQLNLFKLARILRDSWVWIPCSMIMSDADYKAWEKIIMETLEKDGPDSLVGRELSNRDNIRMVPDILKNGDAFYFPVFTSEEEMGEYGDNFSRLEKHFLEAVNLARNNEKNVAGIVINAFTEPFVVPRELFDTIAGMDSGIFSDK